MANNGGALLGGLLIGGLVVGAAMSAGNAADRQNRRNYTQNNRQIQQQQQINATTYCICGAQMVQGRIQQGIAKCNNLNCQKILTGSVCYYCPNGGNVQQHRNGFFYCGACAFQLRRGNKVIKPVQTVKQSHNGYPAQQTAIKHKAVIVKQGYMNKKGNWFNTGYKKRWFKLWSNKKMAYLTHPGASYTKGYADFTHIKKMEKKGKHGFEVTTTERVWSFLCQSEADRNEWFLTIQNICTNIKPVMLKQPIQKPQVNYVPAPQPQVRYVQPMQNMQPPVNYVPAPPPQPQVHYVQPVQPNNGNGAQPMYPIPAQQQQKPSSQSLQPGMVGYNVGNMYGNNNNVKWEDKAPPPAFAAASAPPEEDLVPSAPSAPSAPVENQKEGAFTGQ